MTIEAETTGRVGPILDCHDCGLEQRIPALSSHEIAYCRRCGGTLERRAGSDSRLALALVLTACFLLIPANFMPLMTINFQGAIRQNWLISAFPALQGDGFPVLGGAVVLFTVAAPVFWAVSLALVLGALEGGRHPPWLGPLFRLVETVRPWAMLDVYLLGSFVAYTRLRDVASVEINFGGWTLVALALVTLAVDPTIDKTAVWRAIGPDDLARPDEPLVECGHCGLLAPRAMTEHRCPRCAAVIHRRKPFSLRRTSSLVIAAYLLYIPANLLPVMTIVRFGREMPNTILSGVIELVNDDMLPLALIVFMASIAVPLLKLFGLTWFLISIRLNGSSHLVTQTRLYRVIEVIGRWSNIDVFMISILVALIQYGILTRIQADSGAFAFAAVVVLTILASDSFDPRLMWDNEEETP